jgi:ureidoacrylate peracid hydrolase
MHRYVMSESTRERLLQRRGRLTCEEEFDPGHTAFVVIDMQNHFVDERFPGEVPLAREIVPTINRLASVMRTCGATVVWVQTVAGGAHEDWNTFHKYTLAPERRTIRRASLDESSEGFQLYPKLDVLPTDLRVKKIRYSAFINGSSDVDAKLKGRGIDALLIAGTATNVCCESSARDATMLDYRVIMLSDATATWTDEEHAATLNNFSLFFGEVMTTDDAIGKLGSTRHRKKV